MGTNQKAIEYEKIKNTILEITRKKKIEYVLLKMAESGVLIPYPLDSLSESFKNQWGKSIEKGEPGIFFNNFFQFSKYEKITPDGRLKAMWNNELTYTVIQDYPSYKLVFGKEITDHNLDSNELSNALIYRLINDGKITKEEALEAIKRYNRQNAIKLVPTDNMNLSAEEFDEFIFETFGEKFKSDFARIELEENPLLNPSIIDVLKNVSPSFNANDLLDEDGQNSLEEQRNLLINVIDTLYATGNFESLAENTYNKVKAINELLDEKVNVTIETESGTVDVPKTYEELKNRINRLDLVNSKEDKIELIMLSRQMLNKYTKDMQHFEDCIASMYIDRNKSSLRENLNKKANKKVEELIYDLIDTWFDIEIRAEKEFWNKKEYSGIKGKIKDDVKSRSRWRNAYTSKGNGEDDQNTCIMEAAEKMDLSIVYNGRKIPINMNTKKIREILNNYNR